MISHPGQLRESLVNRRWFGGKGRALESIEIIDEVVLSDGPPRLVMALGAIVFVDGGRHIYHLLLSDPDDGRQTDALGDPYALRILGPLMARGTTLRGHHGSFHFGGPGLDPLAPPGESVRIITAEQSNSSLVLDEAVIVKLFRRVEIGPNPDLELSRLLTNEGFENIPAHVGEINYEGDSPDTMIDLAIAQQFVTGGREGWREALNSLRSLFDALDDSRPGDTNAFVRAHCAEILQGFELLGDATASLHVVLAREDLGPDLAPEPINSQDLKEWAERARHSLKSLIAAGRRELEELEDHVEQRIEELNSLSDPGLKSRIHGDYHLGQVMLSERGWMILDFEGEPLKSLEERRDKQSPLRDVAGMLRSFSYAASSTTFERAEFGDPEWERLWPWARAWEDAARDRFLAAYLRTSHEGEFLSPDREMLARMLDVFEIDKALYELAYEASHRPDWAAIPLRGIRDVLQRGSRT